MMNVITLTLMIALLVGVDALSRRQELEATYNIPLHPSVSGFKYNQEIAAIVQGRVDRSLEIPNRRNGLLCVTFTSASTSASLVRITDNMSRMKDFCVWAIILYNGTSPEVETFCGAANRTSGSLIHCKRSPSTLHPRHSWDPATNTTVTLSSPKSVLYHDLLPYLSRFEKVFMMDDDISLVNFNYSSLRNIWDCAFPHRPLIVQPLVSGKSPQYITFVNHHVWQKEGRSNVLASSVGLVEQQVPLFDAQFFEWFVKRVLVYTKPFSLKYGADWGHDRSWCNAAKMYSQHVLYQPVNTTVCALIVATNPVHHMNLRSMQNKRAHRELFRSNAAEVLKEYMRLFPSWVSWEVLRPNNPLDHRNRHRYRFVYNISYC